MRTVEALWRFAAGDDVKRVATVRFGGLKVPCDLREALQRQYYFFGSYFLEDHILDAWSEAARDAHVVFDVGANGGIYSLAAIAARPTAVVHAFEPTPEIAERLRQTIRMNGLSATVHETAVSQLDGYAALRRCGQEVGGNEGMNYVVIGGAGEQVRTVRLDSVCSELGLERVDLLKLDIQGAEADALEGARELLSSGRIGMIFLELNWTWGEAKISPATAAVERLRHGGYVFAAPSARPQWREAGSWLYALSDVMATIPARPLTASASPSSRPPDT